MATNTKHVFGGKWTEQKLQCLEEYLRAYKTVMSKQSFRLLYIDAFSGTGERFDAAKAHEDGDFPLDLAIEPDQTSFFEGSVVRALRIDPPFDEYMLIEKNQHKAARLSEIAAGIAGRRYQIKTGDANAALKEICANTVWNGRGTQTRAVLFLDPYGCQVEWSTLQAVAATGAIDMWYLFPAGLAVNRMVTAEMSKMPRSWQDRLDLLLGATDWRQEFFSPSKALLLPGFEDLVPGATDALHKTADIEQIERYFISRLKAIFPAVAKNSLRLRNSRGYPMFSLCFASANPGKGGGIAVRVAQHLLERG